MTGAGVLLPSSLPISCLRCTEVSGERTLGLIFLELSTRSIESWRRGLCRLCRFAFRLNKHRWPAHTAPVSKSGISRMPRPSSRRTKVRRRLRPRGSPPREHQDDGRCLGPNDRDERPQRAHYGDSRGVETGNFGWEDDSNQLCGSKEENRQGRNSIGPSTQARVVASA